MHFWKDGFRWFGALGTIVFLAFIFMRPLNDPTQRIIAADGLGYYAYLPARLIYHDKDLNFKWFDKTFNDNYDNHLFEQPVDNFMVPYHEKKINKYYPGQSLLQLPFFLAAHVCAHLLHYPADGFTLPYQLGMGISALFYALLGLFFCERLLRAVSGNRAIAITVTLLVFFGTNLFTYTVFSGCYSHSYSFCMLSLAYYAGFRFFNSTNHRNLYFLLVLFCSVVLVSIRPLNMVLLAGLFYFYVPDQFKGLLGKKPGWRSVAMLLAIVMVIIYNFEIIHRQTGSWLINSYAGEKFYFDEWRHVADNLWGFQYGMLWYTPLIVICLSGILLVVKKPELIFMAAPLVLLVLLYSFWWYWNIVSRVIVDGSVILAVLLMEVVVFVSRFKNGLRNTMAVCLLCVPFFQLKAYQLRRGILDNNYTYAKYYFKHFLTLKKVHVFPVNPKTVIMENSFFQDFENQQGPQVSAKEKFEGLQSALLDSNNEYACSSNYSIPEFFSRPGYKKIRTAFWMHASSDINNIHLVFKFSRNDSLLVYLPFYIKDAGTIKGWDFKEFGSDLPAGLRPGDRLDIYFWNPDHKNTAYIDNLKTEFLLTDGSDEVTNK